MSRSFFTNGAPYLLLPETYICERGPEWSERLCGTYIKIKCAI
jgi:hypothetical protein